MDQQALDKQVMKMYGSLLKWELALIVYAVLSVLVSMGVVSLFAGSPFDSKYTAWFITVTYYGWLMYDVAATVCWILLAAVLALTCLIARCVRRTNAFRRRYAQDCDEELYLALTRRAVELGKEKRLYRRFDLRRSLYIVYRQSVLPRTLINTGRLDEAREYIETELTDARDARARASGLAMLEYSEAMNAHDAEKAAALEVRLPWALRHSWATEYNRLGLAGEYERALELVSGKRARANAEKVVKETLLARCCKELGRDAEAAEHYRYAAGHGNNMRMAEEARTWLAGHEPAPESGNGENRA